MASYKKQNLKDLLNNLKSQITTETKIDDDDDESIDLDMDLDTSWLDTTEFRKDEFIQFLEKSGLKEKTISNHIRNIDKYENFVVGDKVVNQDNIFITISQAEISNSQKLTISSTMSKYLQFINSPNDKIVDLILSINNNLQKSYEERNRKQKYKYTKEQLSSEIEKFYEKGMYKHYIISYLVYNFNVRNTDLNMILCFRKPDDNKHNYLYVEQDSKNKIKPCYFVRNNYKTQKTYGQKIHKITSRKFYIAYHYYRRWLNGTMTKKFNDVVKSNLMYKFYNTDKKQVVFQGDCVYLFSPPFYNSTNIVKRFLPFNLKTSDMVKIILKEDNSLNQASKIGKNRGTSLQTLQESYNLKLEEKE